jgi:hypothetical protein
MKVKYEMTHVKVKQELNSVNVREEMNDTTKHVILGVNAQLNELPTANDNQKLGHHQFATILFNAEVNLIPDWKVKHKPQMVKRKRYIHHCRHVLLFLYQEDSKFDLAGDTVQVWDDVCPRNNIQLDPLYGAWFLSLSDYSVADLINPKFAGAVMGLSKDKNVAMLFRKVSKRRCQQINKKVCVGKG